MTDNQYSVLRHSQGLFCLSTHLSACHLPACLPARFSVEPAGLMVSNFSKEMG